MRQLVGGRRRRPRAVFLVCVLVAILALLTFAIWLLSRYPGTPRVTLVQAPPLQEASLETWAANHGGGQPCASCHPGLASEEETQLSAPIAPLTEGEVAGEEGGAEGEEGEGGGPTLRLNWFWRQRTYPADSVPLEANARALEYVQSAGMAAGELQVEQWQSLGPAPIEEGLIGISSCTDSHCDAWRTSVSGRVKAIAVDPKNSNTLYVGTATGGLWKSTNAGASFIPLTDSQPTSSFFSLAIDPANSNVIYAGTGEVAGYYGIGILKSTDAGQTWTRLGATEFAGMVVTSILIHPQNSNLVYAATAHPLSVLGQTTALAGVFRSRDGGRTWSALLQCQQACYGFTDLVMEDASPSTLYAAFASAGILKTTDGGDHWKALAGGFPDRGYTRVELAIGHGSGSGTLYAGLAARVSAGGQIQPWGVIFRSTDHGETWAMSSSAPNYCGSQCDYDNTIAVDPRNPQVVYIGGSFGAQGSRWVGVVHKSTDGGQTWTDLTPATALNRMVHPDMHAIALDPSNPSIVWVGNDGGLFRSSNGGSTWEHRNTTLSTLEFVHIGVHPTDPNVVFGGLQDNAKAKFDGVRWVGMDSGDGGFSDIDPFNPSIWYSTRYSMQGSCIQFQRNDKGGTAPLEDWPQKSDGIDVNDRVQFYVPFELDRSTPGVIYLGTNRLYRTANRGDSWTPISGDLTKGEDTRGSITAIAVAPSDPRTLYVGTSDGNVQVTANRGSSWTNATKAPLPNRHVGDIAVDPKAPRTAYVVFNGYDTHTPEAAGHVFKTTDGGGSWQNVTGNLPDIPVLTVVLDPQLPGTIYIGTDIGVFRSNSGGATWVFVNAGLPTVPVYDLELNQQNRMLWAATYGRGVYRMVLTGPEATPTPTPTRAPRLFLPVVLKDKAFAPAQPTATLPPTGPAPGAWESDRITFEVTSDQANVWNLRLKVPVPGCETWVVHPYFERISADAFSFTVDLRENGLWRNSGQFTSSTSAAGTATFTNMYFGMSCGTWSGTVDWTATWTSATAAPTPTATPRPGTPQPSATPASTAGIHGQVRYGGAGISGITLVLRRCPTSGPCEVESSRVLTTTTTANGYYNFIGAPALPAGSFYLPFYLNDPDWGNMPDDHYLWRWYGRRINSYGVGQSVAGSDFDIAGIDLTGPTSPTVSLPSTFTWTPRSLPNQYYAWELFDPQTGESLCYSDPSPDPQFTVSESFFRDTCGGAYGTTYGWFAWAIDGPSWGDGYGDSYYYSEVTFTEPVGPTPTPTRTSAGATSTATRTRTPTVATSTPTPTRTPTVPTATSTPTATTQPTGRIYGQVKVLGAGTSGVYLQLLKYSGGWSSFRTTTSGSGGNYAFTDPPSLASGEKYVVYYGPNGSDPQRLAYWRSFEVTSYTAGSAVSGGNFDIGNVALQSPASGGFYLPVTFSWQSRGVSSDTYSWTLASGSAELCHVWPPSSSASFQLTQAGAANCGLSYLTAYRWYVYVYNGGGYGLSFYYRDIWFLPPGSLHENRFMQEAPRSEAGPEPAPEIGGVFPQPEPLP